MHLYIQILVDVLRYPHIENISRCIVSLLRDCLFGISEGSRLKEDRSLGRCLPLHARKTKPEELESSRGRSASAWLSQPVAVCEIQISLWICIDWNSRTCYQISVALHIYRDNTHAHPVMCFYVYMCMCLCRCVYMGTKGPAFGNAERTP